jgi:hypothetical protein
VTIRVAYRWPNGDEYEGGFKDGMFHGVGIYRSKAHGFVEYRMSEMALIVDRLQWSVDGKKAYQATWDDPRLLAEMRRSGWRTNDKLLIALHFKWTEISLGKAKELAEKVYKLPVPKHVSSDFGKAVAWQNIPRRIS